VGYVMEIDAKDNILRVTLEGTVTDATLSDMYAAVAGYVASHGPCRAIADASRVKMFEVSTSFIREVARNKSAIPTGHMRVFVAPSDFMFGMVRMFQIVGELTRPDLHVVRTLEEAYHLLQVGSSPEFRPI